MSRARGGRSFLAAAGEAAGLGGVDRDKGAAACVAACRDNQHSRQQTERYLATVLYCTVLYCHGSPAAGAGWYTGTSGFDTASSALRVAACLAYGVGWTHERCLLASSLACCWPGRLVCVDTCAAAGSGGAASSRYRLRLA